MDKNRQQDAVEEFDVLESDCESVNEEGLRDEEALADDLKIPFFYDCGEIGIALYQIQLGKKYPRSLFNSYRIKCSFNIPIERKIFY